MFRSRVQAAEMRVLRLIDGVSRMDRLRNEMIQQRLGVESVLEYMERNQLRWFGHMQPMGDGRIPKRWHRWTPNIKRPIGRPRKRWIDQVKQALERRRTTLAEVMENELFEDRRRWRELVTRQDEHLLAGR